MNRIRIKLLGTFLISIFLVAIISLYINFYTGLLSQNVYKLVSIKKAVGNIEYYSMSIVNNLNFYLTIDSEKQSALKSEYSYSVDQFRRSVEILKESGRTDKPIFVIWGDYLGFLEDSQKTVNIANQIIEKEIELSAEDILLTGIYNKILEKSESGSSRLGSSILEMNNKAKDFNFQYQNKAYADAWLESINSTKKDLSREGFSILLIDDYREFADKVINGRTEVFNLDLNEHYYLDKARNSAVNINSASAILTKTVDKELDEAISRSATQRNISWTIIVLSFVISGWFVFKVSRKITDSIESLAFAAKGVAVGDLNQKVNIDSEDEIGYLGAVFNKMVENISKSQFKLENAEKQLESINFNLEQKIKERTNELEGIKNNLETITEERTKELQNKIDELERFKDLAVGRELKMIDLKKEVESLKGKNAK